ncbi:hypothetical protein HYH02_012959 [Chlamydomonas schloesseri]|uniref:Ion transport domain-containing protein n=1 Tax=Chlamydomonas schloesseri TaxID=2026947 RepID=A0A835VWY5_9CHLO|nr:hypothetical protein HYH02_012959 [Chlamydomonas schloesseri]|eukprot:KAG2432387.1 hypothetical protein HYH02_012959 [Chlamydomonas schloesseri]
MEGGSPFAVGARSVKWTGAVDTTQPPPAEVDPPGTIRTPVSHTPPEMDSRRTMALPSREANLSIASTNALSATNAVVVEVPYKFTLEDLNQRSYWWLHEERNEKYSSTLCPLLTQFRDHLRKAVLLANMEICFVRCWQLYEAPTKGEKPPSLANCLVDFNKPALLDPPSNPLEEAGALEQRRRTNLKALEPFHDLLAGKSKGHYRKRHLLKKIGKQVSDARAVLQQQGIVQELESCPKELLTELAFTFAAFQPAILDEGLKGSMSPLDPKSRTRIIDDVARKVDDDRDERAETDSPLCLADLGLELAKVVMEHRPAFKMSAWLLQAACMCGHYELVDRLLEQEDCSRLGELEIIKRLRSAWLGYTACHPLQPCRGKEPGKAHTIDWLDFKCSLARAVLIAHRIVETLIERDERDLTHSMMFESVAGQQPDGAVGAAGSGAASREHSQAHGRRKAPVRKSSHQQVAKSEATPMWNDGDGSFDGRGSLSVHGQPQGSAPAAVAEATEKLEGGGPVKPGVKFGVDVLGGSQEAVKQLPAHDDAEDGEAEHQELTEAKWDLVRQLFHKKHRRPAACKPLALACLHFILAKKKEIFMEIQIQKERLAEEAEARQEAKKAARSRPTSAGSRTPLGQESSLVEDEDMDDMAAAEDEQRRKDNEAATQKKYRKLHRLSVQAAHVAVHSTSLSTVSDALQVVKSVKAWPALDLFMLNDLAQYFPMQCASLLSAIPLEEVDLEDNVLPFQLPPGFVTVAVSDKDSKEFREEGGSGSTQDAAHFATQHDEDVSIEASLLVQGKVWMALFLLFMPSELRSPTTQNALRVLRCAFFAFLWQGPGSCLVAFSAAAGAAVIGLVSRVLVTIFRILYYGILTRVWGLLVQHFPAVKATVDRLRGHYSSGGKSLASPSMFNKSQAQIVPAAASVPPTPQGGGGAGGGGAGAAGGGRGGGGAGPAGGAAGADDDGFAPLDEITALTSHLGKGLWHRFFAHGHNAVVDKALGWGKGSTSISCRKVPLPVAYAEKRDRRKYVRQLDTSLMEKLLNAPGVHPSVFGSRVLRAFILFKWNYFTKYFIIFQFLLHLTYMAVFIGYAFTIKDMEPVDGRESGPGANVPGCQLAAPTNLQIGLLTALAIMTIDFIVQEFRQIRHFGFRILRHTWDLLDLTSVALVVASITLHFSCTSDVSPLTLRGLAAVQIVLLFMRLLYYAMASDRLGSFVRMVLETTYDLLLFFVFLSVIFVGFALSLVIAQGSIANIEQTFIKLFTMMYGDFDADFLTNIDSGALGLDALTQVITSVYMILVTIILLNLLISIISESYERIRENERWESLRNKALLIVESETQLYQFFLAWLYRTLCPPSGDMQDDDEGDEDEKKRKGRRFLYVITPENARRVMATEEDEEMVDSDDEDDDDNDDDGDGQWNGRLGEMKRAIQGSSRSTVDGVRKEMNKMMKKMEELEGAKKAQELAAAVELSMPGTEGGGQEAQQQQLMLPLQRTPSQQQAQGAPSLSSPLQSSRGKSVTTAAGAVAAAANAAANAAAAAAADAAAARVSEEVQGAVSALRKEMENQMNQLAKLMQLMHPLGGHGAHAGHSQQPAAGGGPPPAPLGHSGSLGGRPSLSAAQPLPPMGARRVSGNGSTGSGQALTSEVSEMLHAFSAPPAVPGKPVRSGSNQGAAQPQRAESPSIPENGE